jgi:hypothetical protein
MIASENQRPQLKNVEPRDYFDRDFCLTNASRDAITRRKHAPFNGTFQ